MGGHLGADMSRLTFQDWYPRIHSFEFTFQRSNIDAYLKFHISGHRGANSSLWIHGSGFIPEGSHLRTHICGCNGSSRSSSTSNSIGYAAIQSAQALRSFVTLSPKYVLLSNSCENVISIDRRNLLLQNSCHTNKNVFLQHSCETAYFICSARRFTTQQQRNNKKNACFKNYALL